MRARASGLGAEAGFDDLVLADVVDGQFVLLLDVDQEFAQLRIVAIGLTLLESMWLPPADLLFARLVCRRDCFLLARFFVAIRIDGFHQAALRSLSVRPPAGFC